MFARFKASAAAFSLGLAALATNPAAAATVFETASYTGVDTGDYSIYDQRWIGATFTLSQTTQVNSIGGQFNLGAGTLFGAIVALPSAGAVPSFNPSAIGSNALASAVFDAPVDIADVSAPVSVTLAAGNYAVIFGSNQFGATGQAGMGSNNDLKGSPQFIEYFGAVNGDAWDEDLNDGLRLFVNGTPAPAPEPTTWAMMMIGMGFAGAAMRRRGELVSATA
jgi:hypothetical protein